MNQEQYKHLLRKYYGDIVERGNLAELNLIFNEQYIAHFPGKDLDLAGLKDLLTRIHKNLKNVCVEIEKDELCDDLLCHSILFQANRIDDMSSVEWRSNSKWKFENNKCIESWPTTSINYDKMMACIDGTKQEKKQDTKQEKKQELPTEKQTKPAGAAQ